MRALLTALLVLAANGARAQDCQFPRVALPGDNGLPQPFPTTQVFVTSPPIGLPTPVPRNVEIRLGGQTALLETPAQFEVQLLDDQGGRVPISRDGSSVRPLAPLLPDRDYLARVSPTDLNPCVGCFIPQEVPMHTSVDIDLDPPTLDVSPAVFVFALPSQAEQQRCGIFSQDTHNLVIDLGPQLPLETWLSIAARHEGDEPVFSGDVFNTGNIFSLVTNGGTQPVALADKFLVAFTARDLAGNTSDAKVVGVRARSFRDAAIPRAQMPDLTCDVDQGLAVHAPDDMPTNGRVLIEFPFEEVPVSLQPEGGGDLVALFPVTDTRAGHIFQPAVDLAADSTYDVVTRVCPHCVCQGCELQSDAQITVGSGRDTRPPSEPEVVELREDAAPEIAVETCKPDRPALLVVLEPGKDDTTDATSLRYTATVRIEEGVSYALGAGVVGKRDGKDVVVRFETPGLPRLLGEDFELTLDVEDAAGNHARTKVHNDPAAEEGGCSSHRVPHDGLPAGGLALLALARGLTRRRRA
jgi:hypothetical protein